MAGTKGKKAENGGQWEEAGAEAKWEFLNVCVVRRGVLREIDSRARRLPSDWEWDGEAEYLSTCVLVERRRRRGETISRHGQDEGEGDTFWNGPDKQSCTCML